LALLKVALNCYGRGLAPPPPPPPRMHMHVLCPPAPSIHTVRPHQCTACAHSPLT
jgi:hypothetical protein